MDSSLLLILPLALAAFFLKGIATFGAGIEYTTEYPRKILTVNR
jgi:hypothetical protein